MRNQGYVSVIRARRVGPENVYESEEDRVDVDAQNRAEV